MSFLRKNIIFILFLFICYGCEEEYTPDLANAEPEIVVEGYIEAGENALPPYVLLTRSTSFFSTISASQINDLFIHDADIRITTDTDTIQLEEVCLSSLTEFQQALVANALGLGDISTIGIDICAYLEPSLTPYIGEEGQTYQLDIQADGENLTATTSIPYIAPLDSMRYVEKNDSLVELRIFVNDPADRSDFYRYFTQRNTEPTFSAPQSVIEDILFNGQNFEIPLVRGQIVNTPEDFDPDTFGLFSRGDSITVKWCTIDQAHFNFWNTLEYNSGSEGPFASFTRINSNINGGLGIWGGYAASYHRIIVEE